MTKGKKGGITSAQFKEMQSKQAASPLGQFADTVLGFALPMGKVKAAAAGLRAAGKVGKANALEARLVAKNLGKLSGREIARTGEAYPTAMVGNMKAAAAAKETASSVFPRSPKKGSLGDLEYLPGMTKTQAAVKMRGQTKRAAYRKSIEGTRVTELEKRLNLPKETNAARNKRLNKKFDLPGFDFGPIFKKTPKRGGR
jgi:hypothetical protein